MMQIIGTKMTAWNNCETIKTFFCGYLANDRKLECLFQSSQNKNQMLATQE